ncbi:MAG TPA: YciC family protein [Acidimicrobiia bacterium]|nr:YciC family protein [Acidimicrobiia bacterium]
MTDPMQPVGGSAPQLDIGTALNYAWRKFQQHAGPLIIIVLIAAIVQLAFGVLRLGADGIAAQLLFSIIGFVVGQIVMLGIYRAALLVTQGVDPEPGRVFNTDRLGDYIVASILYSLAVGIGFVLCIIPGIIAAVLFAFYPYFVLDKNMGAIDALSASSNLVRANTGSAVGLLVVAFLLFLLGAVLCGVGLLVTGPVSLLMTAYGYRVLTNQSVAP